MGESAYAELELRGEERDRVLEAVTKRTGEWGLTMPDVKPLVIHFGLNEFWQFGLTEYWVANETEAGYCGKFLFLFDSQTCPCHHHDMKHETFFVVKGKVRMRIEGQERVMAEGDSLVMPTGMKHELTGIGDALLLEVSMPSVLNDNFFTDERIGTL